ncbi:AAA family ATPase [Acidimicrobiia bacterium EGI L10123]|uniref:AAA family ATPase n=1 Tax=Salinilacustrithrix flava TaxID=2957203 RepID=UPI003D7C250F|nr:AAA family ATPase [Acidimicrobiia bacterium EGI L10123]
MSSPNALDAVLERLAARGSNAKQSGTEWMASCPAHDDHTPSLSLSTGTDGSVLLHCHAGCDTAAVLERLGLELRDLFGTQAVPTSAVASYEYLDEDGELLYVVERMAPKRFRQKRPVGTEWVYKLNDVQRVPYRLRELLQAQRDGLPVYVVEGEKDVDALRAVGVAATCNSGGAGKWDAGFARWFHGAQVIVIPDNDDVGRRHAKDVADSLSKVAASVEIRELDGVPPKGDVSDWLTAHSASDLEGLPRAEPAQGWPWSSPRLVSGASFLLDDQEDVAAIWGTPGRAAWASGESLVIVGQTGVGKSTLAQQLVLGRLGALPGFLGMPVVSDERPVLYIAADRPKQVQRSFRRLVDESHRPFLERIMVWRGPLDRPINADLEALPRMAHSIGAGTVVIDSLKDVAFQLSTEEAGAAVNNVVQTLLAEDVEVLVLHHNRKAAQNSAASNSIHDSYGSTWITSGAGSVFSIRGEPGSEAVELIHVKQPGESVGRLQLLHDHKAGTTRLIPSLDVDVLLAASAAPLNVTQLAQRMHGASPTKAEIERMRRALDLRVGDGVEKCKDPATGRNVYRATVHGDITHHQGAA